MEVAYLLSSEYKMLQVAGFYKSAALYLGIAAHRVVHNIPLLASEWGYFHRATLVMQAWLFDML